MKILKVNYKDIEKVRRLDGSYHLSEGVIYLKKIRNMPHMELQNLSSRIFTAGRNKRVYTNKDFGFPYLSNSDLSNSNPFSECKYNSKKYGYDKNSLLKEGMIVTGRVGAIGQTSYITSEFEEKKAMGSDNIIRIVPNDFNLYGYIYTFLASKYGKTLFWQLATGGVQPYISEEMLFDLPIPRIDEKSEKEIHNLIIESSKLRVEASKLLSESIVFFDKLKINYKYGTNTSKLISISSISSGYKRFDSSYAIVCSKVEDSLKEDEIPSKTIKSQAVNIFIGPRSKRNYVSRGVPFLSTSAMQKANPTDTEKYLSVKNASGFIVKKGWLLTTRSGTLGDTIYTLPCIDGYSVSEDAIRIVIKEKSELSTEYIYAFLKSNIGKSSLLSGSYGSVIQHLNEDYIGDIKVPILETKNIQSIEDKIKLHLEYLNRAVINENKAINLIEKVIESWQ